MANKILNGNFAGSLNYWDNGVTDYPFVLDAGRAKGISLPSSVTQKIYDIQQTFAVNDPVIGAYISAWRRYEAYAGSVSAGQVRSRVLLVKPDLTSVELADETKDGVVGEGNILNSANKTSEFTQQGNYKLRLLSYVKTAKNEPEVSISNPYSSWIKSSGIVLSNPNCYLRSGTADINEYNGQVYKSFVVDAPCHYGRVTVQGMGVWGAGDFSGYCRFIVKLQRGATSWTLYDGYSQTGNWVTFVNNLDISGYLSVAGTYNLLLEARVKSSRDVNDPPPPDYWYYPNECWFGTATVLAKWYTYTQSSGYWDNISADIMVKKTKMIKEDLGEVEIPRKKVKPNPTVELLGLTETLIKRPFVGKIVTEFLGLVETFKKVVKKTIKEDLGFVETYFTGAGHLKILPLEFLGLTEVLSKFKRSLRSVIENVGLREYLEGKKISGNVEKIYPLTGQTEWEDEPMTSTQWIKERVER